MRRSSSNARLSTNAIVATVMIFGVTACAQTQRESMSTATPAPVATTPVYEESYDDLKLVVATQPIAELLQDKANARKILNDVLFGEDSPTRFDDDQLAALLELAENDETTAEEVQAALMGSNALSGVAGIPTLQFLHAYVTNVPQPVRGKIRKYYFNDDQKGGYLEVDTEVDTEVGGVVHTDKYFWAIAVRPGTYRVVDRDDSNPDDPFPDTVEFPDGAYDDIVDRHLDQKLFAEGTGIVVIAVKKNGVLLPPWHSVYRSNADSCIDLMFWGYPPGYELPKQKYYCLGRCKHPAVVNTR